MKKQNSLLNYFGKKSFTNYDDDDEDGNLEDGCINKNEQNEVIINYIIFICALYRYFLQYVFLQVGKLKKTLITIKYNILARI